MGKVYTLDENGECMAEMKAMHEEKKLMKVRLERDEITHKPLHKPEEEIN
jgi:hypothetical protein